ncbi:fumarylacetoacetate (FAA) hydrolase family protein [Hoeflea sp. IMCC20628]|uniref:fumarylacetoacetate hydrolase family protein n=1 Tax=Hoeflea sp. IMCC20628 TaxID=1620421 RepID=UPI00063AFF4F|nr:fumarylacetoacetate hydrolase family protein [Hoeflea sp. IMCC20628]AKI00889.1 fumarylacetoacetate (FAA) hydrolase family protein [Hoeflea sp. IMCC20628]
MLETLDQQGVFVGRAWLDAAGGPAVVTLRDGMLVDITSRAAPMVRDICEMDDPAGHVRSADGTIICAVSELGSRADVTMLAPCDLQSIKACGVTFAESMVERVIEERAAGDPAKATALRARIGAEIGASLSDVVPGSEKAVLAKQALIREGLWSQYLEVGIGPYAEVFTKSQPMSAVGSGALVGIHPESRWNNPEPEIVLAVSSTGRIVGAALGNDVNLRDFEGLSALLLGKAKDNNAACAIGPMIRLFDNSFDLDDVRSAELDLTVTGTDGYVLSGHSSMRKISRAPSDLVAQTTGRHHQYPDGFMLFLGTLFAPVQDRGEKGMGFTHHLGDTVEISNAKLGVLKNVVQHSTDCPEWTFGSSHLMRNLAQRGLL